MTRFTDARTGKVIGWATADADGFMSVYNAAGRYVGAAEDEDTAEAVLRGAREPVDLDI